MGRPLSRTPTTFNEESRRWRARNKVPGGPFRLYSAKCYCRFQGFKGGWFQRRTTIQSKSPPCLAEIARLGWGTRNGLLRGRLCCGRGGGFGRHLRGEWVDLHG